MPSRSAALGFVAVLSLVGLCECTQPHGGQAVPSPEQVWLSRIGTGREQTARVCARGAHDRIATSLCSPVAPPIASLAELYRVVRLDQPAAQLAVFVSNSMSLSARIVSELNPRVFAFQNVSDKSRTPTPEQSAVAAFVRGEQMVELAALDPTTFDFNFYLLHFEQSCNQARCTPEDLLTERIERDWTGWTLYADADLVDTPLDCISCHQPFGRGTHKQYLMRQVTDPWMHWGGFRGGDERALCPVQPPNGERGRTVVTVKDWDLLRTVEGATGRYGAVPVADLIAANGGELFEAFLSDSEGLERLSEYGQKNNYAYGQVAFPTREVLCERFHTGTSPSWDEQKRKSQELGLLVPFYEPNIADPDRRDEIVRDRTGYLKRHAGDEVFDVASSWIDAKVPAAVGFTPGPADSGETILRSMCVRCHSNNTDSRLRRARFNAEEIAHVTPATAADVRRRLALPITSPELMPPRRIGYLPAEAKARVSAYLAEHCTVPGACQ